MIKGFTETANPVWPGENCATVFLPYCNLRCPYCDAHQLVLNPGELKTVDLADVLTTLQSKKDHIDGVCISGGEPMIHRDLPDILDAVQAMGFETKLETNGTQPEILEYLLANGRVNSVAMDLKAPLDDAIYERCAGVPVPVQIIQGSLAVLARADAAVCLRCTVCPSLLGRDEVCQMAEDVKRLWHRVTDGSLPPPPLTLQNFRPDDPMTPSLRKVKPFSEKELARMQTMVDTRLGHGRNGVSSDK